MTGHGKEPPFTHDRTPRIGVLLTNLGTPDAPTPKAVRRYLAQFLSDPRVIEISPWAWKPLLHGVILDMRPAQVGAQIPGDLDQGRLAASRAQPAPAHAAPGLSRPTAEARPDFRPIYVRSSSGCATAIPRSALRSTSCAPRIARRSWCCRFFRSTPRARQRRRSTPWRRIFPSARRLPGLRFVESFHGDEGYIQALAQNVNDYWMKHGRPAKLVLSFHGLPRRTLDRGDPYHCFCQTTARLLARELGLAPAQWTLAFQSRFGTAQWLKPYTSDVLRGARQGRRGTGRRVLPRLRRRLPRNA